MSSLLRLENSPRSSFRSCSSSSEVDAALAAELVKAPSSFPRRNAMVKLSLRQVASLSCFSGDSHRSSQRRFGAP
eukprot:scaffold69_cov248-Pinguiococcus_pyrenoidosus.AAC.9